MYSGDIRRSLQITKRAVEICRDQHFAKHKDQKVPLTHVTYNEVILAFEELFNSKNVQVLQALQKNEVVAVLALYNELQSQKLEKVLIDDVQDKCNAILKTVLGW
jgi:Cdc6-like AAA superfamily ATPase